MRANPLNSVLAPNVAATALADREDPVRLDLVPSLDRTARSLQGGLARRPKFSDRSSAMLLSSCCRDDSPVPTQD